MNYEDAELRQLLANPEIHQHVHVIGGYLAEEVLVQHVAGCDIVALPFGACCRRTPLSLLEAGLSGRPVADSGGLPAGANLSSGVTYRLGPAARSP